MKTLKKYCYELLALLLTATFFSIILYWLVADSTTQTIRAGLSVLLAADGVGLYFVLRQLWRTKWRNSFVGSVQKVVEKLAKRLLRFLEKRNIKKGKKATVLKGKTTVSFDFPLSNANEKKTKKAPKWKHLQTGREKLGYLYKQMIEQRIQRGQLVYSSDTPNEIKNKKDNACFENEIFDLYVEHRYQEAVQIPADTLDDLKKKMEK